MVFTQLCICAFDRLSIMYDTYPPPIVLCTYSYHTNAFIVRAMCFHVLPLIDEHSSLCAGLRLYVYLLSAHNSGSFNGVRSYYFAMYIYYVVHDFRET